MCLLSTDYISDARNFQRCGEYELAIMSLNRAREVDKQKKNGVEIEKLLSFNYRKLKQFDLALFHINNAIKDAKLACNLAHDKQTKNDYAICLMNKGIIYETINATDKVEACYLPALEIFIDLFDATPEHYGIIINALLTIGMFYYNQHKYAQAEEFLEKALPYFGDSQAKDRDRRYLAITNTLSDIKNKRKAVDSIWVQNNLTSLLGIGFQILLV